MSVFFKRSMPTEVAERIGRQRTSKGGVTVGNAMTHSGVWACQRLRADLVSELPLDGYRKIGDRRVPITLPPVLQKPGALFIGGDAIDVHEWLYATQIDLDRVGNAFGIISSVDGAGKPRRIDLVDQSTVTVVLREGKLSYRISGETYEAHQVWHERQFPMAGLPVGLSPIAHAAKTLGGYLSAQDFALDWFAGGGKPAAHLKNTSKTLTPGQAARLKGRFEETTAAGQVFVTGSDWEYKMIAVEAHQTQFIEQQRFSIADGARFLGVPSDLIDAAESGSSVTYANITQRNLQFLIMNMQPAITRRERALSSLMVAPRYARLNHKALLRMDPETQQKVLASQITSRQLAPSEARELDERDPFTPAQLEEFDRLFGARTQPKPQEATP